MTALLCLVQVDQAVEFIIDETFQVAGVSTTQSSQTFTPIVLMGVCSANGPPPEEISILLEGLHGQQAGTCLMTCW